MAPKEKTRPSESAAEAKKPKHGFRVPGPENLPDGPWRRKVTKIKKDLIHKAKVKKAYAKIKARAAEVSVKPAAADTAAEDVAEEEDVQIHPTRQLMIKDEDVAQTGAGAAPPTDGSGPSDGRLRRTRRPGYYDKQLQKAEEKRTEAEKRQQEYKQRQEERMQKIAEREKFKKAMAKTRDKDGKKKLGRESTLLLDKVKRLIAEK